MRSYFAVFASLSLLSAFGLFGLHRRGEAVESTNLQQVMPKPVDVNMHDFMEGVFQAPYRRLKVAMAMEPKDNAAWKGLRSDALILAEGGNLMLFRKPEKEIEAWVKYSVDSRDAGAELVLAAKKKDFATATDAYKRMLGHCNACHKQFNEGKNQLAP